MTHTAPAARFPASTFLAGPSVAMLLGALLAGLVVLCAPQVLNDGDTYWHLAAGRWMLDHGHVLKTDVFSYTRLGAPWDAHEWLAEGLMALAWRWGNWSGLLVLFAMAAAATAWVMIASLQRHLSGTALTVVVVLGAACMAPSLLARPHLLALPLLAIWTAQLLQAREQNRAPGAILVVLMALWANLHGSYVFGFVLLGAFALEALIDERGRRWPVIRDWGVLGVLCLCAAMLTPQGVMGLIYPFKIMGMTNLDAIREWRSVDFAKPQPFEFALIATLFVCFTRGVKIAPVRTALLLLLLHMALQHARHQLILAVVAPLILAEPLALALGQGEAQRRREAKLWPVAILAAIILAGLRLSSPITRTDSATSPITALRHVPPGLAAQPVLNDYSFGGYLIFKGVRPFIDGRADMYGDRFFAAYVLATQPDTAALRAMLGRYKVAWTVFAAADPTVAAMDALPGWRRLYSDRFAVIHVRADAIPTPPASSPQPLSRS